MPSPHPHPPRQRPLNVLLRASLQQARSLAVVGIGSDLRGDDIAGILVLRELRWALARSRPTRIFNAKRKISALRASTPALRACAQDYARVDLEQGAKHRVETCQSANCALTGAYEQERRSCEMCGLKTIRLFDGGTAPENLTGEIVRFQPSHILLVDAADLGLKPGAATLIESEAVAGMSFSTHVLPLSILADYLKRALSCRIIILGIQPGCTDFGSAHSPEISQAARRLARIILNAAPLREGERQRAKG